MGHRPAHFNGSDVSLDSHDPDGAGADLGQQDLLESRVTEGGLRAFSGELNSEPAQQTRAGGSTQCRHKGHSPECLLSLQVQAHGRGGHHKRER